MICRDCLSGVIKRAFSKISERVTQTTGPFAHGDTMGAVDIAWLPLLHRAHIIKAWSGVDYLEHYPALQNWQSAIMATGIPEQSVPEDFIERFTSFYLSDQTYLGTLTKECKGSACCGESQCTAQDMECCA